MERKFLEAFGLDKDAIEKVMAENGKDIEAQKAITVAKELELNTAADTIKQLQQTAKEFDGVDVKKLQADLSALQDKYSTDLAQTKLDSALNLALATGKAKNIKAVRALLDSNSIKMDGDKLLGLDDQIKKLRESDAYLFEQAADDSTGKAEKAKVDSGAKHQEGGGATTPATLIGALNEHYNQK